MVSPEQDRQRSNRLLSQSGRGKPCARLWRCQRLPFPRRYDKRELRRLLTFGEDCCAQCNCARQSNSSDRRQQNRTTSNRTVPASRARNSSSVQLNAVRQLSIFV